MGLGAFAALTRCVEAPKNCRNPSRRVGGLHEERPLAAMPGVSFRKGMSIGGPSLAIGGRAAFSLTVGEMYGPSAEKVVRGSPGPRWQHRPIGETQSAESER